MKKYTSYFQVRDHFANELSEAFVWENIESCGLAETMEEAEKHGYTYKLNCYEKVWEFEGHKYSEHTRAMIFTPNTIKEVEHE